MATAQTIAFLSPFAEMDGRRARILEPRFLRDDARLERPVHKAILAEDVAAAGEVDMAVPRGHSAVSAAAHVDLLDDVVAIGVVLSEVLRVEDVDLPGLRRLKEAMLRFGQQRPARSEVQVIVA